MFDKKLLIVVLFLLVFPLTSHASDYVYSWIDDDGVRIFSDKPPVTEVEDLQKYEKIVSAPVTATTGSNSSQSSAGYSGGDDYKEEDRQIEDQSVPEEPEKKINPEIEKLEKEIENIEKRALGPRYSQGMKDNQIEIIKKKIEKLKEQP